MSTKVPHCADSATPSTPFRRAVSGTTAVSPVTQYNVAARRKDGLQEDLSVFQLNVTGPPLSVAMA